MVHLDEAGQGRSYYIKAFAPTNVFPSREEGLEVFGQPAVSSQPIELEPPMSIQLVADDDNRRWLIISNYFDPIRG